MPLPFLAAFATIPEVRTETPVRPDAPALVEPSKPPEGTPKHRISAGVGAAALLGGEPAADSGGGIGEFGTWYASRLGYGYVIHPGLDVGADLTVFPTRPAGGMLLSTLRGYVIGQNGHAEFGYAVHAGAIAINSPGMLRPMVGVVATVSLPEIRVWFTDNVGMQLDAQAGGGVGFLGTTIGLITTSATGSLLARF